jgi:hypothetical protein
MAIKQVLDNLLKLECVKKLVEEIKDDLKNDDKDWVKINRIKLRGMIILAKELKLIETNMSGYVIIEELIRK